MSLEKRNMKEKRDLTSLIKKKHTHRSTHLYPLPFLWFVLYAVNRMFIPLGEMHGECIWIKRKENYPPIALTFHLLLRILLLRIIGPPYPPSYHPGPSYPPPSSSYPPPSFVSQDNRKEIGGRLVVQYIWIKRKWIPPVALTSIVFHLDDSSCSNCCEWNLHSFCFAR